MLSKLCNKSFKIALKFQRFQIKPKKMTQKLWKLNILGQNFVVLNLECQQYAYKKQNISFSFKKSVYGGKIFQKKAQKYYFHIKKLSCT